MSMGHLQALTVRGDDEDLAPVVGLVGAREGMVEDVMDDNIHILEVVAQLGGKVVMSKSMVPNMGYFAVVLDPDNNNLGLWQTDKDAK